jgi:uncharacterized protein (TIGR03437 family)
VGHTAIAPNNGRIYAAVNETLFTTPRFSNWSGVVRFNQELVPPPAFTPACLLHGGLFNSVPLSPGALMTIKGSGLGPATGVLGGFDPTTNRFPVTLGGVSITVEGKPAPMVYSSASQLNFVAPWTIRTDGAAVPICISFNARTACLQASTSPAQPGHILCQFPDQFLSCALNQDYSVLTKSNPAARGAIVQLFLTGFGKVDGSLVDGGPGGAQNVQGLVTAVTNPLPPPNGCTVFTCANAEGARNVEVHYAGAAPSLILGANQINLRIPDDMPSGLQTFVIAFTPTGARHPLNSTVQLWIK